MATETLWGMIWESLVDAAFGDVGLLFLVLFIVFVVVMAKFRMPIIPAVVVGFILLSVFASIMSPMFGRLLLVLVALGGIALAFVFFKLGRSR